MLVVMRLRTPRGHWRGARGLSSAGSGADDGAYRAPAVRLPTMERLRDISDAWELELEEDEIAGLRACMRNSVEAYQRVDALVNAGADGGFGPKPRHPRLPGATRPTAEENPLGAWYVRCHIHPADSGGARRRLLEGKTLAVKDTIAVAGVPMMNGSRALEGFTPADFEATVVSRALDAGAVVTGKAVAEDLCCSGSSFATALGPVRNPHAPTHAAGGSSSGCGALVGAGEVDFALGTDQGGSVRIPAAWCGCVGLKPTFGLVPYTGIASHEPSLDHVGPMARTVKDAALLLEAIAGLDAAGMDPRQPADKAAVVPKYSELVTGSVEGLRVGVLSEGLEGCEEDVRATTLAAAERLREAGAEVEEVSVPLHRDSAAIWLPLALEGGHLTRMEGGGAALFQRGWYPVPLQQAYRRGFRSHAAELSYTNKFYILFGEYLREAYGPRYYAHCQNLVPTLTKAYDRLLLNQDKKERFDALILPTLPIKALPLPQGPELGPQAFLGQAWCMLQNTAAFDLTGHPALSVNAGWGQGKPVGDEKDGKAPPRLPIGVQVVGRRWEDAAVLNVGMAVEQLCGGDEWGCL